MRDVPAGFNCHFKVLSSCLAIGWMKPCHVMLARKTQTKLVTEESSSVNQHQQATHITIYCSRARWRWRWRLGNNTLPVVDIDVLVGFIKYLHLKYKQTFQCSYSQLFQHVSGKLLIQIIIHKNVELKYTA